MREAIAELKDSMQQSTINIEQDAAGRWPAYNPAWRARQIILKQGTDGSWPDYNSKLSQHCDLIIERLSYGHENVKAQRPPFFAHGTHPSHVADFLQRKTAAALGRQVPLDPEKLDRS